MDAKVHRQVDSDPLARGATAWSRQTESDVVKRCIEVGTGGSSAANRHDADIYRVAAQLLMTRYPIEAARLKQAAEHYFDASGHQPRSFSRVVEEGLVCNLARLRNLLEHALAGVRSW